MVSMEGESLAISGCSMVVGLLWNGRAPGASEELGFAIQFDRDG